MWWFLQCEPQSKFAFGSSAISSYNIGVAMGHIKSRQFEDSKLPQRPNMNALRSTIQRNSVLAGRRFASAASSLPKPPVPVSPSIHCVREYGQLLIRDMMIESSHPFLSLFVLRNATKPRVSRKTFSVTLPRTL